MGSLHAWVTKLAERAAERGERLDHLPVSRDTFFALLAELTDLEVKVTKSRPAEDAARAAYGFAPVTDEEWRLPDEMSVLSLSIMGPHGMIKVYPEKEED